MTIHFVLYETKLCFLRKLILLLFFSDETPLHISAQEGRLEMCRLLVESKADVAARDRCFSPLFSHHLTLTLCLAAGAALHSNTPSTTTKTAWLHTCTVSARCNDALPFSAHSLAISVQRSASKYVAMQALF